MKAIKVIFYQCRICNRRKSKFILLVEHCESAHSAKDIVKSIKHIDLEPDVFNVEKYCQPCEKNIPLRIHIDNTLDYFTIWFSDQQKPEQKMILSLTLAIPNFIAVHAIIRIQVNTHIAIIYNTRIK